MDSRTGISGWRKEEAMDTRVTRKRFLKTAVFGGASMLMTKVGADAATVVVQEPRLDVVIKNGRIIDGTGKPAYAGAVGIRDGRIAEIGDIPDAGARLVIDARGQYVCPGFIDPHAHEEILMLADPVLEKFIRQGVTTLINGNCGHSVTPYRAKTVLEYWWREALISSKRRDMKIDWEGVDGYAKAVHRVGATINSAVLLGYGSIRWGAMKGGFDRPPSESEWKEIERLVASGLEQGAVGMSTGLAYRPCYYATTDECIRVAKILAKHGATYSSHTRPGNRGAAAGDGGLSGGAEAVFIGEKAGCRVQISHYQRTQAAFDLVDGAIKRGLEVAVDIIPQSVSHRRASNRMIEALMVFYPGVFDYSEARLKALLRDPEKKADIVKTVSFFNNNKEQVVIVRALTPKNQPQVGKSVAEIATALGKDPNDVYVDMVLDERDPVVFTFDGNGTRGRGNAGGRGRGRGNDENPVAPEAWTKHARFGPGSDTIPVDVDEPYGWFEHQRRGAFPGYFRQARTAGVPLEESVRNATLLPATQFRLKDRGTLEKGKIADVTVFDPAQFAYPAPPDTDVNDPFTVASGVLHVVVNGTPVLVEGKLNGKKPGKVLI
jgi:N-acyl-D-amino-acid deacylase